jgi:hypothetical protein
MCGPSPLQPAQLRPPLEGLAHVAQRGGDGHQEARVALHAVDELEAARVLELALDGEQVEEGLEGLRLHPLARQVRERGDVAVEQGVHEVAVQLHVAVAQQGH